MSSASYRTARIRLDVLILALLIVEKVPRIFFKKVKNKKKNPPH
jgi:hypothetical protein